MPRAVHFTATGPYELTPKRHSVWLCQCGLSQNKPFCDGSHMLAQQENPDILYVYHPVTQKRLCQLPSTSLERFILSSQQQRVLYQDGTYTVTWVNAAAAGFSEVLRIRKTSAGSAKTVCVDEYDLFADHYLLADQSQTLATMRVNQAQRGPLDCENYYPDSFLQKWRACIGSASRLMRDQSIHACSSAIVLFIKEVWRHQYDNGMSVDIINCHEPMEPFYLRLGYRRVANSHFVHPRISTPSFVMMLVADHRAKTPLREAFTTQASEISFLDNLHHGMPKMDPPLNKRS